VRKRSIMFKKLLLSVCLGLIALSQAAGVSGPVGDAMSPRPVATEVLGRGDEISLTDTEDEELKGMVLQVATDGTVGLPYLGRIPAAGMTVLEFERALNEKFRRFVKDPHITVTSVQFRSRPVSILGAVNNPGVYQMSGPRNLVEMLSVAGGLRPDAGSWLVVTRKDAATADLTAGVTEMRVEITPLLEGKNLPSNVTILPNDVISVAKSDLIYVMGDVRKPGGFVLGNRSQLSLIKALSMAEGLQGTAAPQRAFVMRESSGKRVEVAVDVKKILEGKGDDLMLNAEDVLFIPTSTQKRVALRVLEAAIQTGTGIAIWRR
jgi:polysaccharide export outer membrane protein